MFGQYFWQRFALIALLLAPLVAFVFGGYEDAAGGYGLGLGFFVFMYGAFKLMEDI